MKLLYPITPELITLAFATCQGLEKALRRESSLSILQYRALSHLRQHAGCGESSMAAALKANASQLSRDLGKLSARDYVQAETGKGSAKSWFVTREGLLALDDADIALVDTYNRYFAGLDAGLHEKVRSGLRLTSQSQGHVRVKDSRIFDELAYFESVLPAEGIVTKSTSKFNLPPALFRVLHELYELGPRAKSELSRLLMLAPSTVTWACEQLAERGLVSEGSNAHARPRIVHLTQEGRLVAEEAIELVDRACYEMRVWAPEERNLNQQVAAWFCRQPYGV